MAAWVNNRPSFVKSYFRGEKTPETAAMIAGKKVHALIEAGAFEVKKSYEVNEEKVEMYIGPHKEFKFIGIPDSRTRGATKGVAEFVDYKTGKENNWKEDLPSDLKMAATAWLVWKITSEPKKVVGHVVYIATEWDPVAKDIFPIESRETEVITRTYEAKELKQLESFIVKAMNDINREYEIYKGSTEETVSDEDLELYSSLRAKKEALDGQMKEVADRIMEQMTLGATTTLKRTAGTFYITERKVYEYPPGLEFKVGKKGWTLVEAEEVEYAAKAARKNYELTTEPKTVTKSMGFRPTKEK